MNSRLSDTEEGISDLEYRIIEVTQLEQQKVTQIKYWKHLKAFWGNIKYINICIMGIPERKEKEKGIENVFEEMMAKNYQTWRSKLISRYREHRGSQTRWSQTEPHQDISYFNSQKLKIKREF